MTFTAYGAGRARPVIDGRGAPDTVHIKNMEWVVLEKLEVTNAVDRGSNRRGVAIDLENYGTGRGYVVRDLYVHDVWGDDQKDVRGSGGILFRVLGTERPSAFDGVTVTDNRVQHVDRTGINVAASVWYERADVGVSSPTYVWTPSRNVVVARNTVADTGGDGVVLTNVDGGRVERNRVHGFQLRSSGYNAGIWPWNSDHTAFRYNEASGGMTTRDGMGFDIDEGTNDTVMEFNYSHDNAGGFMLFCTAGGTITDAVFRYNVSEDDEYRGIEMCGGAIESAHAYQNTIYVGSGNSMTVINENSTSPHRLRFESNAVVKEGAGDAGFNLRPGSQVTLAGNVLVNVDAIPANPGGSTADPLLLERGAGPLGYRLHRRSPAVRSVAPVPDDGGVDYFGNRVPRFGTVNPGAYQGAGVRGPLPLPIID